MFSIADLRNHWKNYTERKEKAREDPAIFCPEVLWEFNYLLDAILSAAPQLDPLTVTLSIREAMRETLAPRPRDHFATLVIDSIRDREVRLQQILRQF